MRSDDLDGYKQPILTTVFNVTGALVLIGSLFAGIAAFQSKLTAPLLVPAAIGVGASFMYFGIAQAVDYLGRTAHSTQLLCKIMKDSVGGRLKNIEAPLIAGSAPPARSFDAKTAKSPPEASANRVYYYSLDNERHGPFTSAEIKDLYASACITDETPIMRQGVSDWRRLADVKELTQI